MMKRKVFLFGAGAVLDWKAPSTSCLTDAIRKSGFLIADQSKTVTELLYETLTDKNENLEKIVNFETIINAIEELIVHYANLYEWERNPFNKNHLPGFHQMLFQTNLTEKIFGCKKGEFSIKKEDGTEDPLSYIDFNGKKEWDHLKKQEINETPEQYILRVLLVKIYSEIYEKVHQYGQRHKGKKETTEQEEEFSSLDRSFIKWMNEMKEEESIIRMYSLNYDDMFKDILEKQQDVDWNICDEFESEAKPIFGRDLDLNNLLNERDTDCFYNLHGNTHWRIGKMPPEPSSFKIRKSDSQVNPAQSDFYSHYIPVQNGRTLLITPIISGYQKTERLALTPFLQIHSTFNRDCFSADEIYIIGYSLGDEHINESIRIAFRNKPNLRIHIIDPSYKFQFHYQKTVINNRNKLKIVLFNPAEPTHQTCKNGIDSWYDGRVEIYPYKFEDFLKWLPKNY